MPRFGSMSLESLKQCDERLKLICSEAIQIYDFSVLVGHRTEEDQGRAYERGYSKLRWPDSKHNKHPSQAIDVAPYPISWENKERFYFLAGIMFSVAYCKGIEIRWGGDWDGDGDFKDQSFFDLAHFELIE